jgi:hypothetical protein
MRFKLTPHLLAGAIAIGAMAATGCVGHAGVAYEPAPTVVEPDLVYLSPGVYVVQDYNEPVFYSNGYYWLYRGGLWYRSSLHYRGWHRVYTVPVGIRSVRHPRRYVRYRARPGVRTYRPGRIRDHRTRYGYRRPPRRPAYTPPRHRPATRRPSYTPPRRRPVTRRPATPPRHHTVNRAPRPRHHTVNRAPRPQHHTVNRAPRPRHHTVTRAPARHTRVRTPDRREDKRIYKRSSSSRKRRR